MDKLDSSWKKKKPTPKLNHNWYAGTLKHIAHGPARAPTAVFVKRLSHLLSLLQFWGAWTPPPWSCQDRVGSWGSSAQPDRSLPMWQPGRWARTARTAVTAGCPASGIAWAKAALLSPCWTFSFFRRFVHFQEKSRALSEAVLYRNFFQNYFNHTFHTQPIVH